MQPIWPRLTAMHLNTVLAAVSWGMLERSEGQFDYTLLDGLIRDARAHHLRLVLLWFGSWKNSWSSYAPDWVKRDFERFPRAQLANSFGDRAAHGVQRSEPRRGRARLCSVHAANTGS